MKVHILDDWHDTLRHLPSFARLADHRVTIWTDHVEDPVLLAARLQDAEALVLFRERTRIGAPLLDRLPNLRLISQRSVYPHIDVAACTRNGVLLCSNMHADTPSVATAEADPQPLATPASAIEERLAALRKHVEATSDYVGTDFATQARAMHLGEAPERPIWGEARLEDARALVDEGVPVAPLPFVGKARTN